MASHYGERKKGKGKRREAKWAQNKIKIVIKKGENGKAVKGEPRGGAKWVGVWVVEKDMQSGCVCECVCSAQTGDVDILFYFIHFSALRCAT